MALQSVPSSDLLETPGQTKVSGDCQRETTHEICCYTSQSPEKLKPKKTEQLCKSLILDWWNWSKQQLCITVLHNISRVMLRLCWCNWICAPYQVTFARFLLNPRAFFSRAFFLAFVQETWRKVETFGTKTHPRWIWNKTQRSVVIRSRWKMKNYCLRLFGCLVAPLDCVAGGF